MSPTSEPSSAAAAATFDPPGGIVVAHGVTRVYGEGEAEVRALDGVDVAFPAGRFAAIMGPSGSGKSTLMHILAGLDRPTSGSVVLDGVELTGLDDKSLTQLRRDRVGFIFQSFNLVPTLNAIENICLPLDIAGRKPDQDWLDQVIDALNLQKRLTHRPSELSGGQQQRVAAARALASRPDIIFADEPTGQLDSHASAELLDFMRRAANDFGQTIVLVTHEPAAASRADQVLFLADGQIVGELDQPTPESILDRMKTIGVGSRT